MDVPPPQQSILSASSPQEPNSSIPKIEWPFSEKEFITTADRDPLGPELDPGLNYTTARVTHFTKVRSNHHPENVYNSWVIHLKSENGSEWRIVRPDIAIISFQNTMKSMFPSVFKKSPLEPLTQWRYRPKYAVLRIDRELASRAIEITNFLRFIISSFPRIKSQILRGFFEIGGILIANSPKDLRFIQPDFLTNNPFCTYQKGAKVLVTGANGWLGGHCVKLLLERGYHVRGTVRDPTNESKIGYLKKFPGASERLEFYKASLSNTKCWEKAFEGIDYVLHTASPVKDYSKNPVEEIILPAIRGTLNILQAITLFGPQVKKVIFTSSVASIVHRGAPRRGMKKFTRFDWNNDSDLKVFQYYFSKTLAERSAWEFWINMKKSTDNDWKIPQKLAEELEAPVVIPQEYLTQDGKKLTDPCNMGKYKSWSMACINPSMIWGPLLHTKSPSLGVHAILEFVQSKYPGMAPVGFGVIDVRDCAAAHIAAFENPKAVGRHILSHDSLWFREVTQMAEGQYYFYRMPTRTIFKPLIVVAASFDPKYSGANVRAQLDQIPEFSHKETRSPSLFGRRLTPITKTVNDMIESFITYNMVFPDSGVTGDRRYRMRLHDPKYTLYVDSIYSKSARTTSPTNSNSFSTHSTPSTSPSSSVSMSYQTSSEETSPTTSS